MNPEEVKKYSEYRDYPVHFNRLRYIYEEIENSKKSPKNVLDVGCGTGNITIPLGLIEDSNIMGLDFNNDNILVCEERNTFDNVKLIHKDLTLFDIAEYDYLILTEVLEHIPDYQPILDYIGMNLKTEGKLILTIPNGFGMFEFSQVPMYFLRKIGLNGFIGKVKKLVGKKEPYATNQEEDPHVNFFTIRSFKKALEKAGMKITNHEGAYVFASIFETYLPFVPLAGIAKIDNKLAQILPKFMTSGWLFTIERK